MSTNAVAYSPAPLLSESRSVTTSDGVVLNVQVAGAANALRTLVFVPGWTMPGSIFANQIRAFAPSSRVVVIDPRGQGSSEIPKTGYTLERRTQDLAEVLDTLSLEKVVLVGWSLGVLESLHLSTSPAASRVAAYVLVDNSVGEAMPPKGDPKFLPNLRANRTETVQRFVKGMFKSNPDPGYISLLSQQAQRMSVEDSIALLSYPKPREYWRDTLYAIQKPVAYLVTSRFFAQADAVKEKRPTTYVSKFPDAGHAVFVDDPQGFNRALEDFLKQLS